MLGISHTLSVIVTINLQGSHYPHSISRIETEAQRSLSNLPKFTQLIGDRTGISFLSSVVTSICFIFPTCISFLLIPWSISPVPHVSAGCTSTEQPHSLWEHSFSGSSGCLLMPLLRNAPESQAGFLLHPVSFGVFLPCPCLPAHSQSQTIVSLWSWTRQPAVFTRSNIAGMGKSSIAGTGLALVLHWGCGDEICEKPTVDLRTRFSLAFCGLIFNLSKELSFHYYFMLMVPMVIRAW